jgi:hypothetical protein
MGDRGLPRYGVKMAGIGRDVLLVTVFAAMLIP